MTIAAIYPMDPVSDDVRYDPLDDDEVTVKFIRSEFQDFDLGLYRTKWFDYRHMTPLQATRHYVEAYAKVYKSAFARELDHERAQYVRGLDLDEMLSGLGQGKTKHKANFVGCWRGRQIADALGMPYEVYVDLAMTYRMRRWQRAKLPRPCHLYHEYDVEKVQLRWNEIQESRLYLSSHPAYLAVNYQGIAHQDDYLDWLFRQAAIRSDPAYFLAAFVGKRQLTADMVQTRTDSLTFERVERYLTA